MIEFQNRQVKLLDGSPVNICLIKGSIDGSTLFEFEEKLLGFLDHGVRHLIIVFSQVHYINSTGMGVLVKLADKFQEVGGDFNLVDVPDKMVALFNMLGLLSLIKLSKNEDEALKSFQSKIEKQQPAPSWTAPSQPNTSLYAPTTSKSTSSLGSAVHNALSQKNMMQQEVKKSPSIPAETKNVQATSPAQPKEKKIVYVSQCKHCKKKISLGASLKEGTYKCPACNHIFKILASGKIEYLQ